MIKECPFCEEIENPQKNIITKERIVLETKYFVVFPTTGGIVDNYQLIVPKRHINCFGQITKSELKELRKIINWQKNINKKCFNSNTIIFEHGALKPHNESGKSIVHAHLHIFPSCISLINEIEKYKFNHIFIKDIVQLKSICQKFESYLYYCDVDNKNYVITHQGIPSQFMRKVLADSLGIKEWNWRNYPMSEMIEKNIEFYQKNYFLIKEFKEEK